MRGVGDVDDGNAQLIRDFHATTVHRINSRRASSLECIRIIFFTFYRFGEKKNSYVSYTVQYGYVSFDRRT